VNIALIAVRAPVAGGKGDATRVAAHLRELAKRHDITVIAPRPADARTTAEVERLARACWLDVSSVRRAGGAAWAACRGEPVQVGWMMPRRTWKTVLAATGTADVVVAHTARALRGATPAPLVLDHIDALSLNMARRAHGPERAPVRWFAGFEARRLRRWERRIAGWAGAQVVTSQEDADALPQVPKPRVVPQGWSGTTVTDPNLVRDIDVIFTGNMRYPPNRSAVQWADSEIVPLVRARHPQLEAWAVGRAASSLRLTAMTVASDVPDIGDYLARSKIALVPLRDGTGSANKVLEAAAFGAALVGTSAAINPFDIPAAVAEDPEQLADAVIQLLEDDAARERLAGHARASLARLSVEALVRELEKELMTLVRPSGRSA
jgi:hypothetical protein